MKGTVGAFALFASMATSAQQPTDPVTQAQDTVRRIVVYGDDPCPPSTDGEIVVCARLPETERYRIPEELREDAVEDDPASESWASRAKSIEYVGDGGIQSCSAVGPSGFTGCWADMVRQAREERRRAAAAEPEL
jgi:hypothetical protein